VIPPSLARVVMPAAEAKASRHAVTLGNFGSARVTP